jgi:hypothetical protein
MFRRLIIPALATLGLATLGLIAGAALAQTPSPDTGPSIATADEDGQDLQRQIRDKLAAEGFKDVHVRPTAFLVSAKDKDDKPVVMLIGPNSMTVLHGPDAGQNGIQGLGDKDQMIKE